jgi:hypothetical protein
MNCPYCEQRNPHEALICTNCGRDLVLIRVLMEKFTEIGRRVDKLETMLANGPSGPAGVFNGATPLPGTKLLAALGACTMLLVLAHVLIIVWLNLPLIYLRLVSVLIPTSFGFLSRERTHPSLLPEFLGGVGMAVTSVLIMSAIVGAIDNVPVLPRNAHEWREFAEYGASIGFGFFTGVVIRHTVIGVRAPSAAANRYIGVLSRTLARQFGGEEGSLRLRIVATISRLIAAILSAMMALITGLGEFF